jgi:hypothetical protein
MRENPPGPLYVVTGYMRSGTSMMMQALEAGGMTVAYQKAIDKSRQYRTGHLVRYYELAPDEIHKIDFPSAWHDCAIKVLVPDVPRLYVHRPGMHVVLMRRHPDEIRQSYQALFGPLPQVNIKRLVDNAARRLAYRLDVLSLHQFEYQDVIADPLPYFRHLSGCGWPINATSAAQVIDPSLCHFIHTKRTLVPSDAKENERKPNHEQP